MSDILCNKRILFQLYNKFHKTDEVCSNVWIRMLGSFWKLKPRISVVEIKMLNKMNRFTRKTK